MKLRPLELKDAPYMLEWMHDPSVVEFLQANFSEKTIEDCISFIKASREDAESLHMAIVNEVDEYQGTVSLKHIENQTAEFAITIRSCAMGKGFSRFAMAEIIKYGLSSLGLSNIYWCVSLDNHRARRFYDKNGYHKIEAVPDVLKGYYSEELLIHLIWYVAE